MILCDRVGDQEHGDAIHHADGLPAFFAALDPILPGQAKWVAEDVGRFLEGDPTMLLEVGTVFGFVPSKSHSHVRNVTTKM